MSSALSPSEAAENSGPSLQEGYAALQGESPEQTEQAEQPVEEPTVEITDEDQGQEVEVNAEPEAPEVKEVTDPGRVEIKDPEVQQKFDWLWKTTQEAREESQALAEMNKNLMGRLENVEQKQNDAEASQTLQNLKEQLREAIEEGDVDRQIDLQDAMTDYKAQQRLGNTKEQVEEKPEQPQVIHAERDIAISNYLDTLASETNDHGQFVRPWMQPQHPKYQQAVELAAKVTKDHVSRDPRGIDPAKVMSEVDKLMGLQARQVGTGTVLNSDGDATIRTPNTIKLTTAQVRAAEKMGITPERYANLMNSQQSTFKISDLKKK